MRILIGPLALSAGTHVPTLGGENPGMGGTEHTGLQLALRLSEEAKLEVTIGVRGPNRHILGSMGLMHTLDLSEPVGGKTFDAAIIPVWQAEWFDSHSSSLKIRRRILWSHHPHDHSLKRLCARGSADAVVSVGGYQYLSNRTHGVEHYWIPNPYPQWAERPSVTLMSDRKDVVGHVGALVRAKGFHRIARHWSVVSSELPRLRLEVLGSGALYGQLTDPDSQLPMDASYGRVVRQAFGGASLPTNVDFIGLVDSKVPYLDYWRYAIQNLTGGSEAMPASVQELIVHGIPVIGSRNYGMWDFMDDFPEITVTRPRDYPDVLMRLEHSADLADEMVSRCRAVSERWKIFDASSLLSAWISVLQGRNPYSRSGFQSPPLPNLSDELRRRVAATHVLEATRLNVHKAIDTVARLLTQEKGK